MELSVFVGHVTSVLNVIKSGLALMVEPPLLFFTCAAAVGVILRLVKRFIPHRG